MNQKGSQPNFEQAMIKVEYDAFVDQEHRSPTQDPIYNHHAGDPDARSAAVHEGVSGLRGSASPQPGAGDNYPHISEATEDQRTKIFGDK